MFPLNLSFLPLSPVPLAPTMVNPPGVTFLQRQDKHKFASNIERERNKKTIHICQKYQYILLFKSETKDQTHPYRNGLKIGWRWKRKVRVLPQCFLSLPSAATCQTQHSHCTDAVLLQQGQMLSITMPQHFKTFLVFDTALCCRWKWRCRNVFYHYLLLPLARLNTATAAVRFWCRVKLILILCKSTVQKILRRFCKVLNAPAH